MRDGILLPVDGTGKFNETLGYLRELGQRSAPELYLLHVQEPDGKQYSDAAKHPLLEKYHAALKAEGWQISAEPGSGDPADGITRFAVKIDPSMQVMSTHGRSGLENIRKGSVTGQVVRQSPCPVFTLHSTRTDTGDTRQDHLFRRMLEESVTANVMRHANRPLLVWSADPQCPSSG